MRWCRVLRTLITLSVLATGVLAAEGENAGSAVRLVPLRHGSTLWREKQSVELKEGSNVVEFSGIPITTEDASIWLACGSENIKVLEVGLSLTPENTTANRAVAESKPPAAKICASIVALERGSYEFEITMRVGGLSILPRYVAVIRVADMREMNLQGILRLNNACGVTVAGAAVYLPLEASPVSRREAGLDRYSRLDSSREAPPAAENQATALYLVPHPVTVGNKESKSVMFLAADHVTFTEFILYDALPPGVADSFASGTPLDGDRTSRDYAIRIANGSTLKLVREIDATKIAPSGMRLPAANVEILRPDINDFLFQEGCMRFDRTANKYQLVTEPVVGVDASRRQKSFKEITPGGACEETMAISLRNRTAETQSVRVREYLARSPKYRILECAPDYVELAPNLLQFELQIPPNQTSNVTYTVRYEF